MNLTADEIMQFIEKEVNDATEEFENQLKFVRRHLLDPDYSYGELLRSLQSREDYARIVNRLKWGIIYADRDKNKENYHEEVEVKNK